MNFYKHTHQHMYVRGAYDKFPDFFLYGHLKLTKTLENSV